MDLWQTLAETKKTVVMYGMGNGADKILAVCERYGIEVKEFFASDDFVRGQQFHGKTVRRFSDVCEQYGAENLIVLVSFASSLPDVMDNIARVASVCETYIPDVPVKGDTLFCEAYEREHKAELDAACDALADERSREVFRGVVEFRRTGRLDILLATQDDRESVMRELLHLEDYKVAIDAGAYDGDTARELIELCPQIERIYAFEPDRRNFRKLSAYAEGEARVLPVNAAVWNQKTTLIFEDSGNRNAGVDTEGQARRTIEVAALPIDAVCEDERIDYIKYDVEGSEREAIEGSARIIREQKPDLLISLYHRTEDLHELILQVKSLCPEYRL
ncbi:MAG: FkbM family methyltransferase, partial [Clostridia bacterium]|nr:FkbM family methyltransferase [Clostridia bacterium]